jgi:hypothetical protein
MQLDFGKPLPGPDYRFPYFPEKKPIGLQKEEVEKSESISWNFSYLIGY